MSAVMESRSVAWWRVVMSSGEQPLVDFVLKVLPALPGSRVDLHIRVI